MSDSLTTSDPTAPTLEVRGVVKTFPGVRALDGIDLTLRAGRLNALMGENGAGKSTLMKVLAGVYRPEAGELLLNGSPVSFRTPSEAQAAGIAIIHQELNLAPHLTVAENLFLGREPVGRFGLLDRARMRRESREILARMEVEIDPDTIVSRLTVATQQVIEIARALSLNARVLILDEPTSALTSQETDALLRRIVQLKGDGVALAYITHRFEELETIADEVTVLRDGKLVGERAFAGLGRDELVRMMIGREVMATVAAKSPPADDPVLTVRRLSLANVRKGGRPVVDDVSLEVRRGEVVGLFGLMGAGRTEMLEALYGVHPNRTSGEVLIESQACAARSPQQALAAGLGLVPEDRKLAGLVLGMGVGENITLASLDRVSRGGLLQSSKECQVAKDFTNRLKIKTPSRHTQVRNLSGGNQQKVVLAKILATGPTVLLLDEPTRGIDIGAKQEVYGLIHELTAEGCGVLLVSSEATEVLAISNRILVMSEGRLTAEFTAGEADEHRLIAAALPTSERLEVA